MKRFIDASFLISLQCAFYKAATQAPALQKTSKKKQQQQQQQRQQYICTHS